MQTLLPLIEAFGPILIAIFALAGSVYAAIKAASSKEQEIDNRSETLARDSLERLITPLNSRIDELENDSGRLRARIRTLERKVNFLEPEYQKLVNIVSLLENQVRALGGIPIAQYVPPTSLEDPSND